MSDASVTRSRFAKITGWKSDNPELEPLLKTLKKYHSKDNFELVYPEVQNIRVPNQV